MSPVTGHEIFFCRFLQQTGSSRPGLELDFRTVLTGTSESMGKTSQAATTYTWELFDHISFLQNIFLTSAKLNFHRPLVCSTMSHTVLHTRGWWKFSLADIKKIFCRSDLWSKSSHVLVVAAWNVFPILSLKLICQKPARFYLPKWLCWAPFFKCI